MKSKHRLLSVIFALAITAGSVTGCSGTSASSSTAATTAAGSAAAASSATTSNVLRVGINADCSDLGPFSANSNGRNSMLYTLYEYLGDLKGVGGDVEKILMKDYKTTDNKTYDIEIYDNIYDTAGNHITAKDVVWCFQQMVKAGTNTNTKYIVSVKETGDYTLQLVLNCDFVGGFINVVKAVPIVSEKAYEASPDQMATTPIGTTGYKLTNFVSGSSATFEKTGKYWQADSSKVATYSKANVDKITYTTYKEPAQMAIALETGAIDMAIGVDSSEIARFMPGGEDASKFTVFHQITNIGNQMYLSGDTKSPFYNNQALRQAICYAISKDGLVKSVLGGYGVVEYTFGGDTFSDFNSAWKSQDYYNYNLDKAKELLAQSGANAGQLTLRIMTDNTDIRNKTAQVIQAYLTQLGIQSTILQYDSALFNSYKNSPSQWDIMLDNTGSSDYLVSVWRGKFDARQYPKTGTINGWQDNKLQSLLVKAVAVDGHQQADVDAFHSYLKDQAYGMGLFNQEVFTVAKTNVANIVYDPKMFVYVPGTTFK